MNLKAWILMHLDSDVVRSSAKHRTLRNYSHVTPLEIELLDRLPVTVQSALVLLFRQCRILKISIRIHKNAWHELMYAVGPVVLVLLLLFDMVYY